KATVAGRAPQQAKAASGKNQAEASPRAADEDRHAAALLLRVGALRSGATAALASLHAVCQRAFARGPDRAPDYSAARRVSGLGLQDNGEGRRMGSRDLHSASAGRQ